MGINQPPVTSDEVRKKLYDSKPLKFYRPPLQSDPRSFVQKVQQLSLLEDSSCNKSFGGGGQQAIQLPRTDKVLNGQCSSGLSSHLSRKNSRAQITTKTRKDFLPKQTFSICNFDGKSLTIKESWATKTGAPSDAPQKTLSSLTPVTEEVVPLPQQQSNSDITKQSAAPKLKNNLKTESVCCTSLKLQARSLAQNDSQTNAGNGKLLQTRLFYNSAFSSQKYLGRDAKSLKSSQNWRLASQVARHQTSNSYAGAPKSTFKPICEDKSNEQDSLSTISEETHVDINDSSASSHLEDCSPSDEAHLKSYCRCDESLDSLVEDDVVCLNPHEPVPQPILLLPVPEQLRTCSPDMGRSSPEGSSSGVSSLSQRTDGTSSQCSLRSNSPGFCSRVESLTPTSQAGEVNDSDVGERPTEGTNSLDTVSSSCKGHVIESWKASLTATGLDKPKRSFRDSNPSKVSARPSRWDVPPKSDLLTLGLPTAFGASNALKRKAFDAARADTDVEEIVLDCFSKRFTFEPSQWELPDVGDLFSSEEWELPDFIKLKQRLNSIKDELNDLSLQDWHAHTRRRNKAGNVIWQLRKKINPEFLTQAWCKMYENLCSFPLVSEKAIEQKSLNSVHLCEAPGAFITCLNHYLRVHHGRDFNFDWRAVTLNPYYEGNPLSCMINDDRLLLKTLDKWLFGQDYTGDLMVKENLIHIIDRASELGEILLITADGSFDCQDNPSEQEEIVAWLHYCECVASLSMLACGGSFLIKMFTFFEHSSICLLYLLNCVFEQVIVNKPVTSKEGNSEVYVVCCGYRGAKSIKSHLGVLMEQYGPESPKLAIFPLEKIPSSFLDQIYRCAEFFCKVQGDVIKDNIRFFHNPMKRDSHLTASVRHRIATTFFDKFKPKKLDEELYIVGKKKLKDATTYNIDPKLEEGSFNDRRKRMQVSPLEELKYLKDDLHYLNVNWPGDFDVFWLDFPENPKNFKIMKGKPIAKVNSSKFCLGSLLKIRNKVRDIAHSQFHLQVPQGSSKSDMREIPWPDVEIDSPMNGKVIKLNFENRLWSSLEDGSNAVNEKIACREILSAVENMFRDDCLELRGYPLLTQFNVGLVFLLGHLFDKVGFVRPEGQDIRVLFYRYRKFHPEMKHHWDEVVSAIENDSDAVLSVVQISELSDGDFYKYVTEINNLCVLEQIQDLLRAMSAEV